MVTNYAIFIIVLAILIVLFVWAVFSSSIKTTTLTTTKTDKLDPTLSKGLQLFGGDIYALIPEKTKRHTRKNKELEKLFIASGNPFGITQTEFFVLQILLGIAGGLTSLVVGFILQLFLPPFIPILLGIVTTLFLFYYPKYVYKAAANDRIYAYKTTLPEAIDFLVIAMAGGTTPLNVGIQKIIPYLPKNGVMYNEFTRISDDMNSGKTMTEALNDFALRAPTPEIEAFVNALNTANRLNTPISGILRERAKASRKDRDHEIELQIQSLPTKVMMVFGPVSYVAILVIALAPAAAQLTQAF